ncbi:MAG: multiheme c-type cytochrome [Rhodospirillales bacterium]
MASRGLSRGVVRRRGAGFLFLLAAGLIGLATAKAQETSTKPFHLGVQTCASSTCHGAVQPWQNSSVLQNEFVTWQQHDAHAKAYETLLSDKSKLIAANLGLKDAHTSPTCLQCHADNVPEAQRAKFFRIEDGVGCETCHGGAENWLGLHVAGTGSHADNIVNGMYPTDDPDAVAELCLGCHSGMGERRMSHRILGAGHPRLRFELDTFLVNQPAHYRVDDDYRVRKTVTNGAHKWAVGQLENAEVMLTDLMDPSRSSTGIFPEFAFFDCHACHHPMKAVERNTGVHATGPGVPRLNDASLIMVAILARVVDAGTAQVVEDATRDMHRASIEGMSAVNDAVDRLRNAILKLRARVDQTDFTPRVVSRLFQALVRSGTDGRYVDYLEAEQATMAAAAFLAEMERASGSGTEDISEIKNGIERLYAATENENTYRPETFAKAMASLKGVTN